MQRSLTPSWLRRSGLAALDIVGAAAYLRRTMFAALKKFISEFTDDERPHAFAENDYRLAAAALLVHAAGIDGKIAPAEREKLHAMIKQRFELDDSDADELIAEATALEQEAVDLYRFTSLLNRSLDDDGRRRIVEMMWQVAYADAQVTELEDNLIWRAADLLGVSQAERIALRQRVRQG